MSLGTFFKKVEQALKRFVTNPSWEQKANSVINYVAPIVETVITLTAGGPAEKVAAAVIGQVQSDLATVSAVLTGAQAAPGSSVAKTAATALNSIKDNLGSLLAAAEVKNTAKNAEVTSTVNLIVAEVEALLNDMPTSTAVGPASVVQPAK